LECRPVDGRFPNQEWMMFEDLSTTRDRKFSLSRRRDRPILVAAISFLCTSVILGNTLSLFDAAPSLL
jgi:hypothetical protein